MAVGVVDVGSNTVRVVVARGDEPIFSRREMLHLGADVERYGAIRAAKLDAVAAAVAGLVLEAREAGAERLEVLVTSPGRQATNGARLVRRLEVASGCPVRVVSAAEEARLAFVGAVRLARPPGGRPVAVIDVGGGSAQVASGSRRLGPTWSHSLDVGSQRLTSRFLEADPPGPAQVEAARAEVAALLERVTPPRVARAYAVGGSARALRRVVGPVLGWAELAESLDVLACATRAELVARYRIGPERAGTLAGGAVVLDALASWLGRPLHVVRGGLREGALHELAAGRAAA